MLAILFFIAIFAALGWYVWRDRKSGKVAADLAKIDAAAKAEAERLKKLLP